MRFPYEDVSEILRSALDDRMLQSRAFIREVHCKLLILSKYEVLKVMKEGWCKHVIELPAEAL